MKRTLLIILAAALAAGAYWRGDIVTAAAPYVSQALAAVGVDEVRPAAAPEAKAAEPAAGSRQRQGGAGATGQTTGSRRGSGAPARVTTAAATAENMPILRRTIGTIASPASLTVTPETSGLVTAVLIQDGADVKQGDVLIRLDDRIAEATVEKDRAALTRDQATLDHARQTAARQQKLLGNQAVSQQSLEDANAAVKTSEATVAVDEATLKSDLVILDQMQIRAPFDGRLGAFDVVVGSYVQPQTSLVRLTRLDPLYATFTLAESDADLVRAARAGGSTIEVTAVPLGAADAFTGAVDFVDTTVDSASGSFVARATLTGAADKLLPGQSISVTVAIGSQPVVAVPTVALQSTQAGTVVYVVGADGTVAVKPVTVALAAGDRSGIDSGLAAGERVVVEGQVRLAAGMKVIDGTGQAGDNGKPAVKLSEATETKP